MTDFVDAMVDEAVAANATDDTPPAAEPEEPEEPASSEPEEPASSEPEKPADEPFPKKAINALSRRDKKIGKLQAEVEQLKRELQSSKKPVTTELSAKPREEDFDTYGEYLAAVAKQAAREEHEAAKSKDAEERNEETSKRLEKATAELTEARAAAVTESGTRAQAAFSDFVDVIDSVSVNVEGRMMLPLNETAKEAFLEAGEDAAFALYSLAKEGTLEDLNEMSLARAAMVVARHVEKGKALAKPKTESTAPAPVSRPTGSGKGRKQPTEMNADEILAWVNS